MLPMSESPTPDAHFDGGEMGCGDLLFELMMFVRRTPPGSLVQVRALDPGAPLEIPAWCRLTGHTLLAAGPPLYLIKTKS
jgi:tRNA 2-thiouridine synthesizing protein A